METRLQLRESLTEAKLTKCAKPSEEVDAETTAPPRTRQFNCCGVVECVWTKSESSKIPTSTNCATTPSCLAWNVFQSGVLILILVLCSVAIHTNEPAISECKQLYSQEQIDCLHGINGTVVGSAFAVAFLVASILLLIRQVFVIRGRVEEQKRRERRPPQYKCVNGWPNRDLCGKIGPWIFMVLFHVCIVTCYYSARFDQKCDDEDRECVHATVQYAFGWIFSSAMGFTVSLFGVWHTYGLRL